MREAIIRHWKPGDDKGIFDLFDRTARWVSNKAYCDKFNDEGLTPEGILVAGMDGLIIGHLMGTRTEIMYEGKPTVFGAVGQVMVDENYRGRGIGKGMIQRIIHYHKENGCRGILLWTQENRIPAYPIYEKFGFRTVARRVFYRFQIEGIASQLSVKPYAKAFAKQTEEIRQEWLRISFPVGVKNMKPSDKEWWVIHRDQNCLGYVHIGGRDNLPLLSQAVARSADASEMCDALFQFLREIGHKEAIWQTSIGSVWEEELQRRGLATGQPEQDVRMCLSIGSPIDIHGQRPEFDGCSTW